MSRPQPVDSKFQVHPQLAPMLVETLMRKAFDLPRTPRSKAYMEGVQWALDFRIRSLRPACPYAVGTAEADAFFAGRDEGYGIWRNYQAANPTKFGHA